MLVPGLAAGRPRLGHERPQALRAAVDRGGEPGRPGAEHDEVEALAVDLGPQAELARDLRGRRVAQHVVAWTSTGVSSRGISSHSSIAALSGSVSTSYQRTGSRLRSSRSRTSKARREPRAAISRMTPWPSSSCQARRASSVRKTCSPNSGQRATISRSPARSNTITSVGSTATQALIVGSPVKSAMSPMNVRPSASAMWTSLPGLRSTNSTRPRSMT